MGLQKMHERLPPPGSFVWIRRRRWRVRESRRDRAFVRLEVDAGERRRVFLSPLDMVNAESQRGRPVLVRRQRLRHALTALAGRTLPGRGVAAAIVSRVDILPHQLEPALAIDAGATRILIADAVGLGKTIQAGLVAREVTSRRPAARILLVVPSGLHDQWTAELVTRFELDVAIVDRGHLDRDRTRTPPGADPWRRAGILITSPDFIKQPHVIDAVPCVPWDLLIIDEAHGVCGDSTRYRAVARLARDAQRVLLLTATPHSGDALRFDRLCRLGSLGTSGDELVVFRRARPDIGDSRRRRVSCHHVRLGSATGHLLSALLDFEAAMLRRSGVDRRPGVVLLLSVFRKRVLSTAHAALATFRRRLEWLDATGTPDADAAARQLLLAFDARDDDDDSESALAIASGLPGRIERSWLGRLIHLAGLAAADEPKVSRVAALLSRTEEPAVVFTEFRASVPVLASRLSSRRSVAVIHGGLTLPERADALRSFEAGRSSVLVATDVASQGLNLQGAARWVVSLDLPWNPARLEQRFGRVDRIGQTRPVHLTLIPARHAAEAHLLRHLRQRTRAAERALGQGPLAELLRTAPTEEALQRALIAGDPVEAVAEPAPAACARYRRPARRHATTLRRLRRLTVEARTRDNTGRPIHGRSSRRSSTAILVFEVAITDASGVIVERTPAAVRVSGITERAHVTDRLVARATAVVTERMAARVRRLGSWRGASGQAGRERLDVTKARLDAARSALETQPGLFDHRADAAWLADEHRLSLSIEDVERALPHTGRPTLSTSVVLRVVLLPA